MKKINKNLFYFASVYCSILNVQSATHMEDLRIPHQSASFSKIMEHFQPIGSFEQTCSPKLQYQIAQQRLNLQIFGLLAKKKENEALPMIILLSESGDLNWKIYHARALYEGRANLEQDQEKAHILYDEIKQDPFFNDVENEPDEFMKENLASLESYFSEEK